MKVKNIVENSLEISNVGLTSFNDAASMAPVPYLQQAAGLALGILNIFQVGGDYTSSLAHLTVGYPVIGSKRR